MTGVEKHQRLAGERAGALPQGQSVERRIGWLVAVGIGGQKVIAVLGPFRTHG